MRCSRRQMLLLPVVVPLLQISERDEGRPVANHLPANILGLRIDDVLDMWGMPDHLEETSNPQATYVFENVTVSIPNFWNGLAIDYFVIDFPLVEVSFSESRRTSGQFVPSDALPVGFGTNPGAGTKVFRYNSKFLESALDGVEDTNSLLGWSGGMPGDFTLQPSPYYDRPTTVPAVFVMTGFPTRFHETD